MNSLRQFQFYAPIGTEGVRLEGSEILGRWKSRLQEFPGYKNRLLVEDFVNWGGDAADIIQFTEQYAPVTLDDDPPHEGQTFRFQLEAWRGFQRILRSMWEARMGRPTVSSSLVETKLVETKRCRVAKKS